MISEKPSCQEYAKESYPALQNKMTRVRATICHEHSQLRTGARCQTPCEALYMQHLVLSPQLLTEAITALSNKFPY